MRITKILSIKKPKKRLAEIKSLVQSCRKIYGNKNIEIAEPKVATIDGKISIKYLTDADKAHVASIELNSILKSLNDADANIEGVNVDYEAISLISTSEILCNLDASIKSTLI